MGRPADWYALDLDKDPVPGDPYEVKTLARTLGDFADDVATALRSIRGLAGDTALLDWVGLSGDAFRKQYGGLPKDLDKLETSYRMASGALGDYWPQLEHAQSQADKALSDAQDARQQLTTANSQLSTANDWVGRANTASQQYQQAPKHNTPPPDPQKVQAAAQDAANAAQAKTSAQNAVDSAQDKLDAAKQLAAEASALRDHAADSCSHALGQASDAGIHNKSFWQKLADFFVHAWHEIVAICKVIVAVLGIVVMIIGGPLAWVVAAAAVVVLADTVIKCIQGKASLLDVAFAALDCIPAFKGLTTAGGLFKLAKGAPELLTSGKALERTANGIRNAGDFMRAGDGAGIAGERAAESARAGAHDPVKTSRPVEGRCLNGDPIDMVSGEMVMLETDLALPGTLPLVLTRTYLSSYRCGRWFGPSWASTLDEHLEADGSGVVFAAEDGMLLVYPIPRPDQPVLPTHGPRWPLEWDGTSRGEIRITDPGTGRVRHFVPPTGESREPFDLLLAAVTDRNGNRITIDRDPDGVPTMVHHSGGYRVAVDSQDHRITALRVISQDDAAHSTTVRAFRYGPLGDLTDIVNGSGPAMSLDYDERGRIVQWTDRNDSWYRFTYDEEDRCVAGAGADGFLSCTVAYDTQARTTEYTDSLGHTTTHRYNERLQLVSRTDPLGSTTVNEWDARDFLVAQTDALGHTSRYSYTDAGLPTSVTFADGSRATAEYNELHLPTAVTEPDGGVWHHFYDEAGRLLRRVGPSGGETRLGYDRFGGVTSVTDALGHTLRVRNDPAGLPLAVTDPLGNTTTARRNSLGCVDTVTDALGLTTRVGRTATGQPLWRERPDGGRETWEWDDGSLLSRTDAAGHTSRYTYTHFGMPASRTDPDGTVHTFSYDTELRLAEVTNPDGLTWSYEYDAAGNLTSETDFNGRRVCYTRDAAGRLASRSNGAGQTVHYTRDALGRTLERHTADNLTTFAYDSVGNLVRAGNRDARIGWTRDHRGRVLSEDVNDRVTTYSYDAAGNRLTRRTPGGVTSRWNYDPIGRPIGLTTAGGDLSFAYDAVGQEIERRLGRDISLSQTWDTEGRLATQTLTAGARRLQHRTHTYRADGHLLETDDLTTGSRHFDLAPAGRVTAVRARDWTQSYAYDATGNLVRAAAPRLSDPGDREFTGTLVRRAGRTTYRHDGQGRLVERTKRLLNGQRRTWTYTWDAEDRLTDAVTPEGERWHYTYDPLGRRLSKQRLGDDGAIEREIRFTWDGTRLAEEEADEATTTWEYAPDTHRPLSQSRRRRPETEAAVDQDEIDIRFHAIVTSLLGTPTELVTESGELSSRDQRMLWDGGPATGEEEGVFCPLRFPGQYADPETGLHYNYFRHYDPETARYVTPDPLGLAPADNQHAYVGNPHTWSDPHGLAGGTQCGAQQLADRAAELQGEAGWSGTTAVVRVQNRADPSRIETWVASNKQYMPTGWSRDNSLGDHEVFIKVPGAGGADMHAEERILHAMQEDGGWDIVEGGTSTGICWERCYPSLIGKGVSVGGPEYRSSKDNSPWRQFWIP